MVAIKFLLGLAVLIFLVTFAVKNMDPKVTIEYYFDYSFGPIPFFFSLLGSAVFGLVVATLYSAVNQFRLASTIRKQRQQIAAMEKELLEYKKTPPEPVLEPEPLPEPEDDADESASGQRALAAPTEEYREEEPEEQRNP